MKITENCVRACQKSLRKEKHEREKGKWMGILGDCLEKAPLH